MNDATSTLHALMNGKAKPFFNKEKVVYRISQDQIGLLEYCPDLKHNFFYYFDENNDRHSDPWIYDIDIKNDFIILDDF